MSPWQRALVVQEIARQGFTDALEILQLIEVMEGMNRGHIISRISDVGAGSAGIVVMNGLITRITLLVTRCFSITRDDDLHLRRAFELLGDPMVMNEVEKHGSREALAKARTLFAEALVDSNREQIKHFRDKLTAHLAKTRPDFRMVSYSDFFEFARKTTRIMEALAHGVGDFEEKLDDHVADFANAASALWHPWD